jgi:hypothetical protein
MQIVIAAPIKMCVTKTCFVEKYKHKIDVFRPSHVQRDLTTRGSQELNTGPYRENTEISSSLKLLH